MEFPRVMEFPVVLRLPASGDCIVLDDYMTATSNRGNLARIDKDGLAIWRVLPATGTQDAWVGIQVEAAGLRATTWTGWSILLDFATGAELTRTFVK